MKINILMESNRIIRRWRFKIRSMWTVISTLTAGGYPRGVANTLFSPAVFCILHFHFVWRRKYRGSCHVRSSGKWDPWAANTVRVPWVRFQRTSEEMTTRRESTVSERLQRILPFSSSAKYDWRGQKKKVREGLCTVVSQGSCCNSTLCILLYYCIHTAMVILVESWVMWSVCCDCPVSPA